VTAPDVLVRLDGGTFRAGSDRFYPEEGPVREVTVAPFAIARDPVTNREFARFVQATGYVTTAERPLDPADFPGADLASLEPGSLVFTPADGPVDLRDWSRWWRWVPGASWRHPGGPGSDLTGRDDHPVVQVSFDDASTYARWAGLRLPTEAEWELAARGSLDGATYAWGEEPNDGTRANTWQGSFPYRNTGAQGSTGRWSGTSPVGQFPPNGYGLHDMTGNVWEWTTDLWSEPGSGPDPAPGADLGPAPEQGCGCGCGPDGSRVGVGQREPAPGETRRVLKGGSHLCAPEYCLRYRPAARSPQTPDSATTHLGFRCVTD
jgi:sulfatase modifying factor 1